MSAPAVLWPTLLGLCILAIGSITYRRDLLGAAAGDGGGLIALGPVFVAASLAAFAGEHFTAAASLAQLVPKWLPGRLFIAYFVGVAHLAAAVSFVARRYVRWSALGIAVLFALFVLLMDLPGAIAQPATRMNWILAARETTFAIGGLALYAAASRDREPAASRTLATLARLWTAGVLVLYGVQHLLHPTFAPGVPSTALTAAWVPFPQLVAYATGLLLVACGAAMFAERSARAAAAGAGWLTLLLTVALYVPQYLLARGVAARVTAINFVFDTLLFAGAVLVVGRAIAATTLTASEPLALGLAGGAADAADA